MKLQLNFMLFIIAGNTFSKKTVSEVTNGVLRKFIQLFHKIILFYDFLNPMKMSIDAEMGTQCVMILVPVFVFS